MTVCVYATDGGTISTPIGGSSEVLMEVLMELLLSFIRLLLM